MQPFIVTFRSQDTGEVWEVEVEETGLVSALWAGCKNADELRGEENWVFEDVAPKCHSGVFQRSEVTF